MTFFFGHFVVAVLLPAGIHFGTRKPGLGVDMERRERVGNRQGSDVGLLRRCWLRGRTFHYGFLGDRLHGDDPLPTDRYHSVYTLWRDLGAIYNYIRKSTGQAGLASVAGYDRFLVPRNTIDPKSVPYHLNSIYIRGKRVCPKQAWVAKR